MHTQIDISGISELHISHPGIKLDTVILISCSTLILPDWFLSQRSHTYDVANGIKILRALPLSSECSYITDVENRVSYMLPKFVFSVLSQDSSKRFSSTAEVNSDGALAMNVS